MADLLTGYGDGSGYGSGYGYGYGDGYGYGYGDGYGYGYGYGSGYGDGSGYVLPDIAGHAAFVPWPGVLRIGCQCHTIGHWRERWRDIAHQHGTEVDAAEMLALLARAESASIRDIFQPTD